MKLKKILRQQNISQADFARRMGVTRQAVHRWTKGNNYPGRLMMMKISVYLKVPIDKLFFED